MGFRALSIQDEYRSLLHNVVRDFYIPVLSEAVLYQRAVGFFSSSALISLTEGIRGLLEHHGSIEVIASPNLSEDDLAAIRDGFGRRDKIVSECLLRELNAPSGKFEEARLNLLSNLIASGVLTIKIALLESGEEMGMFHEKLGLMYDGVDDAVAFTGSMNETANAFFTNYESIDVFTSWGTESNRVKAKQEAFSAMWNNTEPGISVLEFPEVSQAIIEKYKVRDGIDLSDLDIEKAQSSLEETPDKDLQNIPRIPDDVTLRGYQVEAIDEWERNRFRGVFDMATGTGKTFTGLAAVCRLAEATDNGLAVIIVCPYQHLVDQWVDDIKYFNIEPIIGYSSSPQRDWETKLNDAIRAQRHGAQYSRFFCFICTNGTFATDRVQRALSKIRKPKLLMVDEAHNFGAEYLRSLLKDTFEFRLALSATIERYGDEEGTSALFSFFGKRCIEYTLEEAIYGRGGEPPCLTPYRYHPVIVYLEDDELKQYRQLSLDIAKAMRASKCGKQSLTEHGKKTRSEAS